MTFAARLLAATLGRAVPRYRTLDQWAAVYCQVIAAKPVDDKTKANRRCSLNHIVEGLGRERIISDIRPHDIGALVMGIYKCRPQLAKRVLIEAKDCFNEAVNYAWLNRSPAAPLKSPKVTVQRKRLTLDQWRATHAWSTEHQPPWASRLLVLALVTGQRRSDLAAMRFADIWDGHLHVEQAKTGMRIALPLSLRLDAIGITLAQAVEDCRGYAAGAEYLLRKHNGKPLVLASLSARFEEAREAVIPAPKDGFPPSLHECRSLSERLYRQQGVNTMILLGHSHQSMTDLYNDDRGLSSGKWRTLVL